jgi:hypothetical protein
MNVINTISEDVIETDTLLQGFKYKYEELKYILDMKLREFHHAERNYKEIIERFHDKFEELESVNMQLRDLVVSKDREIDSLINRRDHSQSADPIKSDGFKVLQEDFNTAREELERLKERFTKKYNYIKDKYYILKNQNKEKDEFVRVLYY